MTRIWQVLYFTEIVSKSNTKETMLLETAILNDLQSDPSW